MNHNNWIRPNAVEAILFSALKKASALLKSQKKTSYITKDYSIQTSRWKQVLATLPLIGTALLPKLTCPACWPAYAGILSSLGLGFVNYTPYLFPLTVVFLIVAIVPLGYSAIKNRRGYKPFILGVVAMVVMVIGKFVFTSDIAMYGGVALLVGVSLWNAWPQKVTDSSSCLNCVPPRALSKTHMKNARLK